MSNYKRLEILIELELIRLNLRN
ncbi:MAG: hypothetical protein AB7W47_03265 [Calditrichaceae bacterium]